MKRTVETIINEMENSGAMMRAKMTKAERLAGLLDYQAMVLRLVFNNDHAENLRLFDVIAHLQELAQERNLVEHPIILKALDDLEIISKEIAIAISGASGERQVARSIQYARRELFALQNVNLSDEHEKAELDQVIVTSNGVMILEVKNYKKDVTISESGQVYGPCNKHYSDKSLGEQMNTARYLLCAKLEQALTKIDPTIKVYIESRVVFSEPSITVTDLYKQEKYCFKTTLPHEIDRFSSGTEYTTEQMRTIANCIHESADADGTYDVGLNFDEIRSTFASALVLLENEPSIFTQDRQTANNMVATSSLNAGEKAIAKNGLKGVTIKLVATAILSSVLTGLACSRFYKK